jgi:hypothetical protein
MHQRLQPATAAPHPPTQRGRSRASHHYSNAAPLSSRLDQRVKQRAQLAPLPVPSPCYAQPASSLHLHASCPRPASNQAASSQRLEPHSAHLAVPSGHPPGRAKMTACGQASGVGSLPSPNGKEDLPQGEAGPVGQISCVDNTLRQRDSSPGMYTSAGRAHLLKASPLHNVFI